MVLRRGRCLLLAGDSGCTLNCLYTRQIKQHVCCHCCDNVHCSENMHCFVSEKKVVTVAEMHLFSYRFVLRDYSSHALFSETPLFSKISAKPLFSGRMTGWPIGSNAELSHVMSLSSASKQYYYHRPRKVTGMTKPEPGLTTVSEIANRDDVCQQFVPPASEKF